MYQPSARPAKLATADPATPWWQREGVIVRLLGAAAAGVLLIGVVLLLAFAFVVLRAGPLAPTQVTVNPVKEGKLTPALFGIGTIEARRAYLIGPTAAGRVLRVLVDVGDTVKAGQLLAEMDPVDLDERIAALDASLARAGSTIAASDAQRRDAQARNQLAGMNVKRCLLYTSDAADERSSVDLGGRRIIKKQKKKRRETRE